MLLKKAFLSFFPLSCARFLCAALVEQLCLFLAYRARAVNEHQIFFMHAKDRQEEIFAECDAMCIEFELTAHLTVPAPGALLHG